MRRSASADSMDTSFFKMPRLKRPSTGAPSRPLGTEREPAELPFLAPVVGGGRRRRRSGETVAAASARPLAGIASLAAMGALALLVFSINAVLLDEDGSFGGGDAFRAAGLRRFGGEDVSFHRWLAATDAKYDRGDGDGDGKADYSNTAIDDREQLRTVHTFFSPIDPHTRLPTNKLNATDRLMLDTWRAAWEAEGWKTKVLTVDDAKKHPDYEAYNFALDSVPLGANAYYNRLCYLRWLAMAASGGGFMSDYDVVPIRGPPKSPSDIPPKFAVYGSGVPTLLSGTRSEWDRMAALLLRKAQALQREKGQNLWSDMMALQELRLPFDEHYVMRHETLTGAEALKRWDLLPMDCHAIQKDGPKREGGYRAVHFSHYDLKLAHKEGYLKQGGREQVDFLERPTIMKKFVEKWNVSCRGREVFLNVDSESKPAEGAGSKQAKDSSVMPYSSKEEALKNSSTGWRTSKK